MGLGEGGVGVAAHDRTQLQQHRISNLEPVFKSRFNFIYSAKSASHLEDVCYEYRVLLLLGI